jgi:hypothetical protein
MKESRQKKGDVMLKQQVSVVNVLVGAHWAAKFTKIDNIRGT